MTKGRGYCRSCYRSILNIGSVSLLLGVWGLFPISEARIAVPGPSGDARFARAAGRWVRGASNDKDGMACVVVVLQAVRLVDVPTAQ